MDHIPVYHEINDLHRLTGATLRTENPLFHCFDMAESNNLVVNAVPPHRTSFYTLALNFGTQKPVLYAERASLPSSAQLRVVHRPGPRRYVEKAG